MYVYCENNYINLCDSTGKFSISAIIKNIVKDTKTVAISVVKAIKSTAKKLTNAIVKASKNLPTTGKPNSTARKPNGDLREYGSDGRATKDTDYSHPNHHPELPNPHAHDWDWSTGVPKRGSAYDPNKIILGIAGTGAAVSAGYLIYRGVRMLPSLLPPLWWTIPANAMVP